MGESVQPHREPRTRGRCSVCGKSVPLDKDGLVADHDNLERHTWCLGSLYPPLEV